MVLFGRFQRCGLAELNASLEVDTESLKTLDSLCYHKLVLVVQGVSSQFAPLETIVFLLPGFPACPLESWAQINPSFYKLSCSGYFITATEK